MRHVSLPRFAAFVLCCGACTSGESASTADSAVTTNAVAPAPAVEIVSPRDGDTVSVPFAVTLAETGVEVIKANGLAEPGKGHHHFIVDGDEPAPDTLPLPPAPLVVHLGDGTRTRTIDVLPPGPHRIIAIFASGTHVPWAGVKRDTVTVIVK